MGESFTPCGTETIFINSISEYLIIYFFCVVVPPSQKPATTSLRIDRFVRPFTLKAVQELLGKTGSVQNFWMDHIKTHCYVTVCSFFLNQDLCSYLHLFIYCIILNENQRCTSVSFISKAEMNSAWMGLIPLCTPFLC